jgi:MerR family transcriptional regulator, heat shock protein HspR
VTGSSRRGGAGRSRAPSPRSWQERLDDPGEPLLTVGVVCDLLDVDAQTLRRLGETIAHESARPSGNQHRYSRADVHLLAHALELSREGVTGVALGRILELQDQVARLPPDT